MTPINIEQYLLGSMKNFVYIIACPSSKKAAIVDPAWDIPFLLSKIKEKGWQLDKILITHHHHDHVNGLEELLTHHNVPIYANHTESDRYHPSIQFKGVKEGDQITIGQEQLAVLETPGHAADSLCFQSTHWLITGDTLFIDGCGRCDLTGSNVKEMYNSLQKLKTLPETLTIYPGHHYATQTSDTLKHQKKTNPYLTCDTFEVFYRKRMGTKPPTAL